MKPADLQQARRSLNETNDCAVRAVAAATDTHYADVHSLMARNGRKPRRGTPNEISRKVLDILGFKTQEVTPFFKSKTIRTLGHELKYRQGTYLVWTRGHILAIVDGEVKDFTKGRCHRVRRIERVVRKERDAQPA
jgi:hypothetical protein